MKFTAVGAFPEILGRKARESARATVLAVSNSLEAAFWVARRLRAIGYGVEGPHSVEASVSAIEDAMKRALSSSDVVVATGGVEPGFAPTFSAAASALGRQLVESDEARRMVEEYYYLLTGAPQGIPDEAKVLYMLPEYSTVLRNVRGPAPGILLEEGDKYVLCLPGSLLEASSIIEDEADPYLRDLLGVHLSATVHVLTKTWDENLLQQVAAQVSETEPWVFAEVKRNVYSKEGMGVSLTVFARAPDELSSKLLRAVKLVEGELSKRGIEFLEKNLEDLE